MYTEFASICPKTPTIHSMKIPFIIIILIWATTTIASISRNGDSSVHPRADIAIGDGIINSIRTEHEGNTSDANTASTNAIEPYPTTDTQDPLDTSLPGTSENRATINALGLNCRGSARCPSCNTGIDQILESLSQIKDLAYYRNGEKIVCRPCYSCRGCTGEPQEGPCVFAQKMGRQEIIFAFKVREKVEWIKRHGCHRCGSCPVHTGNDGSMGEVTINFVFNGCGNGVCRPYDRV
ncbi:hypothetical protein ACJQWK_05727 [Exserohilum turcicum]